MDDISVRLAQHGQCRTADDLYGAPSRGLILRLCRDFLIANRITPTELLHDASYQQKFLNAGVLYQQAVQKVAIARARANPSLQAPALIRSLFSMGDEIFRKTLERSKLATATSFDAPSEYQDFVARIEAKVDPDRRALEINIGLTHYLAGCPSWSEKILRLLSLLQNVRDERASAHVDEILAEVVSLDPAMRELVGDQNTLGPVFETLLGLLGGSLDLSKQPKLVVELAAVMAIWKLPALRGALKALVERGLRGHAPLASNVRPELEAIAYSRLLARLSKLPGPVGSDLHALAEERAGRFLTSDTIHVIFRMIPNAGDRLSRALMLHRIITGPARAQIRTYITRLFEYDRIPQTLARSNEAPAQVMRRIAELHQALMTAQLPESLAKKFAQMLEAVQAQLIRDRRLFETIESAAPNVGECVRRLVAVCKAGLLTPGQNLDVARRRVNQYLNHPEFRKKFVEGRDPQQDAALAALGAELREIGVPPTW